MKIPKIIHLYGQPIEVAYDPKLAYRECLRGKADHLINKIYIQPQDRTNTITREMMEQTFFHELVHIILDHMSREKLNNDEAFVNIFSLLLHQALSTAEYEGESND
jgi:hypothetical protein